LLTKKLIYFKYITYHLCYDIQQIFKMDDILHVISNFTDRNSLLNLLSTCTNFEHCDYIFFNKYFIYDNGHNYTPEFISKIKFIDNVYYF
jgi:hypothetical protein